jgi:hypothetical protein
MECGHLLRHLNSQEDRNSFKEAIRYLIHKHESSLPVRERPLERLLTVHQVIKSVRTVREVNAGVFIRSPPPAAAVRML